MDEDADGDWADFEAAIFSPMTTADPALAVDLSTRFLERLVFDMSPTERAYALGWEPPRFEVGITPAGGRVLGIYFGGGRSVTDWDGTVADAESIDIPARKPVP